MMSFQAMTLFCHDRTFSVFRHDQIAITDASTSRIFEKVQLCLATLRLKWRLDGVLALEDFIP